MTIKFKKLICLITCFFSACLIKVNAQDTTNTIGHVSIASPNAAALGKYGDIPVSYHTGIPQINIPVYTVESGSLKLPISLSYHASGLKVQEQASWVGAGWSLNAGGMITRTVVGAPDDRGYSTSLVTDGHYTDTGYCNYLTNVNSVDDIAFARGYKDGEPDLYFFNFGGASGKFYFNDDRTPMLVPEQDFKILPFTQSGQGFIGFIVTASDGTKYYFGQVGNNASVSPIEITNPFTLQNGPSNTTAAASSWFLNKIISADGTDSITFAYQQENYSYYTQLWSPVTSVNYNQIGPDYTIQNGFNLAKNIVQGVRLTQINFKNGMIVFNPSASPRSDLSNSAGLFSGTTRVDNANTNSYSLGSITITNLNGFCKKDSFYYGYFYDNTALNSSFYSNYSSDNLHTDEYRLRLDSIQETTCDNSLKIPPYRFSYFSEAVPRKLSFGIDHWGYSNGQISNPGLVPTFTVITSGVSATTSGANRDSYWPEMRGGTLQQITYPTGGYTQFDFEPKASYNYTTATLENLPLTTFALNIYGQSQITQTNSFTLNSDGACTINIVNSCTNWSPVLTIYNSSNTQVYWSGFIGTSSTFNWSLSLPAGAYTATLAFPPNSQGQLNGGASGSIGQFQYVPHTTNQIVGGLRIKMITNHDAVTSANMVTSYAYAGNSTTSGGILFSIPTYVQVIRNNVKELVTPLSCSPNGCLSCDGFNAHEYYISAGSLRPMATLQGENVGYNEVDVSQTGNGTTKYMYYHPGFWPGNPPDVCVRTLIQSGFCDQNIPNYPSTPLSFDFMRDELQTEMYFDQSGKLLKEIDHYPVYTQDPISTPGIIGINIPGMYSNSEYNLTTSYKSRDQTISTTYDPVTGNSLSTSSTVYYSSPYHHQATRKVTSTSTDDSLVTNVKYAMDFRIAGCDAIPDSLGYYYTLFHNDSTWMYANLASCTPQTNDGSNCRLNIYEQFRIMMAQDRRKFVTYRRRSYGNDISNLQSSCYLSAQSSADTLLKPILRLQNEYNNATIETSEWKNQNLLHASYTRFDTSIIPVGYVYPRRAQLVNLQSPSSTFAIASVSGHTIAKDSRYSDETLYSFIKGNPAQVTLHGGIFHSYLWDYNSTYPIAETKNASQSDIAHTSFEADGKGNWTFSGTPDNSGGAITGTKSYSLGAGNITNSGLTTTKKYIISYWSKGSVTVSGGTQSNSITGKTVNGWTYHEVMVTGTTSVSISGSTYIDELRLYPYDAQMTTYTYKPLVGMTSRCGVDNTIQYYEYDGLGRLLDIKDSDGNIIKTFEYHYQQNSLQ
ncbi:MAG TPA: hypothetical protein VFI29_09375 [Hanamia sp.]|nr:hypothetical protein [Hanamia sp.]